MRELGRTALTVFALAALVPAASHATVIVSVVPAAATVLVGGSVSVDLVAEFSAPDLVLAWGLDLVLDPPLVAVSGAPALGPTWIGFATPDGDGLGGVALSGVSGNHLLATLVLEGLAPGVVSLGLATTPRERTEGFALDPSGFASGVVFQGATLEVLPEPGAVLLGALVAAALSAWRPRASSARRAAPPPRTA
ncbi:MAG: hypothetical protein ACREI8_13805 [Myxococcota bacterium]